MFSFWCVNRGMAPLCKYRHSSGALSAYVALFINIQHSAVGGNPRIDPQVGCQRRCVLGGGGARESGGRSFQAQSPGLARSWEQGSRRRAGRGESFQHLLPGVEQQVAVQWHVPHFHKGELVHRRFPLG